MEQKLIILLDRDAPQEAVEAWKSLRTNFYTERNFMISFMKLIIQSTKTLDMKLQETGVLYNSQKQINSNFDSIQEKEFCNADHMGKFGNLGFLLSGEWEISDIKEISTILVSVTQHFLGYACINSFLIMKIVK